jgi:hypothetical protein
MMLDTGTVHLKAGDVVVQRATNHAWFNHGKSLRSCGLRADPAYFTLFDESFRLRRSGQFAEFAFFIIAFVNYKIALGCTT